MIIWIFEFAKISNKPHCWQYLTFKEDMPWGSKPRSPIFFSICTISSGQTWNWWNWNYGWNLFFFKSDFLFQPSGWDMWGRELSPFDYYWSRERLQVHKLVLNNFPTNSIWNYFLQRMKGWNAQHIDGGKLFQCQPFWRLGRQVSITITTIMIIRVEHTMIIGVEHKKWAQSYGRTV